MAIGTAIGINWVGPSVGGTDRPGWSVLLHVTQAASSPLPGSTDRYLRPLEQALQRLPYDQVGECWKFSCDHLGQRLVVIKERNPIYFLACKITHEEPFCALIGGATNAIWL
jgi:hypothetical protein